MTTIRRTAVVVAALSALTVPLSLTGGAQAASPRSDAPAVSAGPGAERLELPRPTGPFAVGLSSLALTDTSRTDHWVPSSGHRRVMVTLHYPARRGTGKPTIRPYLTREEARLLLERTNSYKLIPVGNEALLSATRTHARDRARPARGKFPLVVLSPGFGLPRTTLTSLAQQLASNGHVVASVDHAYESEAAEFPGEGVLPCTACAQVAGGRPVADVPRGRAKDISFVLDRLTGRQPVWKDARMIDSRRIGMAGHSIGGNATTHTMATDRRVRAGVNLDGGFFERVPEAGLGGRPVLLVEADQDYDPSEDFGWPRNWPRLDGWKRWIRVTGSHHFAFLDLPALADQIDGAPQRPGPSGRRYAEITHDYVSAFFDQHLKGTPRPLLNGPSTANPEVLFIKP
jgi:dienelactone hydrolase